MATGRRDRGQSGPGDQRGHRDLGKGILKFLDEQAGVAAEPRTTKRQLTYVLSKRTGASAESVARQLGVTMGTLKRWIKGTQKPSGRNAKRLSDLYEKFWRINHDVRNPRKRPQFKTARLIVENTTNRDGIIFPEGRRQRIGNPLTIDASRQRKWNDVLSASTPEQAYKAFVKGVLGPSPLPSVPEYLDFLEGDYSIRVG